MLVLLVLMVAAGAGLASYLIISTVLERAEIRDSLRRLEGYRLESSRDDELLLSFDERVLTPVRGWFVGIGRRITPSGYAGSVARRLEQASKSGSSVEAFMAGKAIAAVLVVVFFIVIFVLVQLGGLLAIALWVGLSVLGFMAPDLMLNREVENRKHSIAIALPDLLDLLTISTEAGLGFEQALDRTTSAISGPLSDEFDRMLHEMRLGTSRADALRALEARTDVAELRSFVLAMLQADTFGISISHLLRAQADEMRVRRRQRAQEQAQKAPVKMLFPLAFCIFPSIFVVMLGPAMISLSENL